ncbi:hypothetical protein L9S41_17625 [Geoalkalibacter halelectricus]|uniref:Uncharacterized protein n=1 Tax=Geoalkalibacter halelectricus TaxID=2847045 RepID=A0ABY5ZLA6_9BACT|nr:hypothetical protein [Geoalkalibacter halelectricus]UWZ79481.1 hypothetical protein L9S41_17625 [Geoalkalibacter halelectricus]
MNPETLFAVALGSNNDNDQIQFNLKFSFTSLTHSENNLPVFINPVWELTAVAIMRSRQVLSLW